MSSPIFLSNRGNLDYVYVVHGMVIAVRGSVNSLLELSAGQRMMLVQVSVACMILHMVIRVFKIYLEVLGEICGVGLVIVCLMECVMGTGLDQMFWESFLKLDSRRRQRAVMHKLSSVSPILTRQAGSRLLAPLSLSYILLRKGALVLLVVWVPSKWTRALVFLWSFCQLQHRTDPEIALLATVVMSLYSFRTSLAWHINLVSHLWALELCIKMLLTPYLNGIPFSKDERDVWFESRLSILYGFGAIIYSLIIKYPALSSLIMLIAYSSVAELIHEVSDPLPENVALGSRQLFRWVSEQVLWVQEEKTNQRKKIE
ncbi:uncharacterized protein Ecym_7317 [Eremothecium cymbalariae DBVPG|uniref:Uncharacterized protein n=1 Tax=Eremothecium cymbalariae (strain CBS 270.75 / DBVPG 7215 / KCTC 17166 / NRRL Y-17582) TaxID=931890 RepID=G8JWD7_ERECY|nr:hypothetical protein Ecym_7317 [Eremothecium cymbalariae DBVPG\